MHDNLTLRKDITRKLTIHEMDTNWELLDDFMRETAITNNYDFTAGENIDIHKVLALVDDKVFHFDVSDNSHAGRCIGVSRNAGITGATITTTYEGIVDDVTLTAGKRYFVGAAGVLTDTIPTTSISQQIGISRTTTNLFVSIKQPIILI